MSCELYTLTLVFLSLCLFRFLAYLLPYLLTSSLSCFFAFCASLHFVDFILLYQTLLLERHVGGCLKNVRGARKTGWGVQEK